MTFTSGSFNRQKELVTLGMFACSGTGFWEERRV